MKTLKYMPEAQDLCATGNLDMLLFRIKEARDIWQEATSNGFPVASCFTERDQFFLGLRYSEFLIDFDEPHTDYNLMCAERQRIAILNTLGVDIDAMRERMIYLFGLY